MRWTNTGGTGYSEYRARANQVESVALCGCRNWPTAESPGEAAHAEMRAALLAAAAAVLEHEVQLMAARPELLDAAQRAARGLLSPL